MRFLKLPSASLVHTFHVSQTFLRVADIIFSNAISQKPIPNFYENLYASSIFDAQSSPGFTQWGTAHSGRYDFSLIKDW